MDDVHNCYIDKFVGETLNHAVLDSGCTENVCGTSWLENYLETLSEEDREKVVNVVVTPNLHLEMVKQWI